MGEEDKESRKGDMIRGYFKEIEEILSECPLAIDLDFNFTVVDLDRGFWRGLVKFRDGSELHLFEYVVIIEEEPIVQDYRYHLQDKEANLVFRYDNAPPHPELKTRPHHLHTPEGVYPTQKLDLDGVVDEAIQRVD